MEKIELNVRWRNQRWYSRWRIGDILGGDTDRVERIAEHRKTGEVRVYSYDSGWPLAGVTLTINGTEKPEPLRSRGFYGTLHST